MMKSKFRYYIIVWAILLAVFNVVVFVTPNEIAGVSKFNGHFWTGYIFITLAFIGQLGVAWYSLKDETAKKVFYRIPLLPISYGSLIAMLIVGTLCMAIPGFPVWLGIILCILVFAFGLITLVQAQTAGSIVEETDTKIKNKVFFIQTLTAALDSFIGRSSTPEIAAELKKLYETARYSDPVSNEALAGLESSIILKMDELSQNIDDTDISALQKTVKEISTLLNDRNNKCKLLK